MKKYTDFIFSKKKVLIVLFMLINIVAIIGITKIKLNTDFASFSPDESIYEDRLDEMEEIFGELNQLIVLVEVDEVNDRSLSSMSAIQRSLEAIENIDFVQGTAPEQLMINNSNVDFDDLSSEEIIGYYENFEDFSPIKSFDDASYFVFTLFINENFTNSNINDIENVLDALDYNSYISGDSYNQLKITDYILKILLILPPLAIIVIFLVFRWQMGAIKPTLLSVLPAGIGSLWTFGS
jgi:predicted RND superfamily exporter protein